MARSAFTVGCSRRAPPPSRRLSQIGASESGSDHGGRWWQDSNAGFGLRNTRRGRGFAPCEQHSSDADQRESRDARRREPRTGFLHGRGPPPPRSANAFNSRFALPAVARAPPRWKPSCSPMSATRWNALSTGHSQYRPPYAALFEMSPAHTGSRLRSRARRPGRPRAPTVQPLSRPRRPSHPAI